MDDRTDWTAVLAEIAGAIRSKIAAARMDFGDAGRGPDGDIQFAIDEIAEDALREACARRRLPVAIVSEGRPVERPAGARPEWWLVADPIDGSRPAKSGMPMWCVCLALARYVDRPRLRDVVAAVVMDGATGAIFSPAEMAPDAGTGVRRGIFLEFCGTAGVIAGLLYGDLIDRFSERGVFVVNSSAWSVTRILAGAADAYLHPARALYDALPAWRDAALAASGGKLKALFPYDLAAWHLIATRAGCVVTDLDGDGIDETDLLDIRPENQRSVLVARDRALHADLLAAVRARIRMLRDLADSGALDRFRDR
ncbi:MAG: hypothetical protein JXP34_25490 [Planctomycetes bacterium]|nr:hypothetical protein [Planctomycetota bacterium]